LQTFFQSFHPRILRVQQIFLLYHKYQALITIQLEPFFYEGLIRYIEHNNTNILTKQSPGTIRLSLLELVRYYRTPHHRSIHLVVFRPRS
jgi:hypothetical protein